MHTFHILTKVSIPFNCLYVFILFQNPFSCVFVAVAVVVGFLGFVCLFILVLFLFVLFS